MLLRILARILGLVGTFFAVSARPAAQLGHVVKAQKVSATSGGFGAQLDEMDQFGRAIVNLGDLDGDGVTDLLVGAHTDDDGGLDLGAIYVLFMHANGFVKAWQKISELEGNFAGRLRRGDQFGRAMARLGDLDGDGVTEVAVSANYDDDGGTNKGAVYILFLNADGTVKASQKISAEEGGLPAPLSIHDEFGRSISSLGDMDGDGVTDLLVGTPEDDEGGTNTGALHVLFLNASGTVKAYKRISKFTQSLAIKPGDWFGFCTASLGDFDGDGVTDVAAGAVLDDDGGVNQGSLWILFLNADGSVKQAREIDELESNLGVALDDIDQFGTSVVNLGDLDGDGITDVAVGAVKDDDGGTEGNPDSDVGAVYVLFLNADASVKSTVKISDLYGDMPYSLDQWDWFGSALARLGGSPGDGLFNVAIGCRNDDDAGGNQGALYLVQLNDGTVPVADFAADSTLGVAPMTVNFTDASTGEVTAWVWNFGSGPQSSLQNPSRTYTSPGTYDVQLLTRGPRGADSLARNAYIQVVDGPLAAFDAAPRVGNCPLEVAFADLSLGEVSSWLWDFGDGQTSSEAAPVHTYGECGSYSVSLTVTGLKGTHTLSEPGFVLASIQPPAPVFTADPTTGSAPLAVQFTDLTSGAVTARWWDFGDGNGSSEPAPLHVYELPGVFTVTLTASGPGGSAQESRVGYVVVVGPPPVAYFDATPTLGPEPLSVAFSDLTTGAASSWNWDFGDGTSSDERNPVHVYGLAGTYTITLSVTGPSGSDTRTRTDLVTVEIAPPVAAIAATPSTGLAPLAVQFSDLSTPNVTSWTWDFGDGAISHERNPAHVYAVAGFYMVELTVSAPGGSDTATWQKGIDVFEPPTTADFSLLPSSGPAPLAVSFTDLSSTDVTAWSWDFGDGGTSVERSPVHVYAAPGAYDVGLQVSSPGGSDVLTRSDCVTVLEPEPEALFTATPSSGRAPLTVLFDDRSLGAITTWIWDFGDGTGSREPEPQHVYGAAGVYGVSLTVTGPGGSSTLTLSGAVEVLEPPVVADFGWSVTTGVAPLNVQFTDASTGLVNAWSWAFGDGGTSSLRSPAHVYTTPGTYSVTLVASGPGGSDSETKTGLVTVQHPAPVAQFAASPTTGVAPLTTQFTDASTGTVTSWSWTFGDGATSNARSPAHVYATPGTYSVTLVSSGPGGSDGETKTDLVTVQHAAPVAQFLANPTTGAPPLLVQFTDTTAGTVTAWSWNFGDGLTSSAQSPAHLYLLPGTYTVTLEARGPGGSDVETKTGFVTVQLGAPIAQFLANPTSGVAPLTTQFTDASTGSVTSWSWTFGDGGTSSLPSPAYVYATPGTYTVTLTARGPGGSDGETKTGLVTVQHPPPVAQFGATPTSGVAPLTAQFTDASTGNVSAWSWTFGDGGTSSLPSPAYVYATPGTYTVTLTARGPGGSDGETKTGLVTVQHPPPVAQFGATPTSGVAPLTAQFTDASTGNVTAWSWTFGDGGTSSLRSPAYTYATPGTYTVTLTARGPGGSDGETKTGLVTVQHAAPVAQFLANPTTGVAPLTVQFSDASTGPVTSWSWDFGDGGTANTPSPTRVYAAPGTYSVTLSVRGPGGTDGETRAGLVKVQHPPPVADFLPSALEGFAPLRVAFADRSTGNVTSRLWTFGDGETSQLQSPAHVFAEPGSYAVTLALVGPGGTSSHGVTLVAREKPLFADGDFEQQAAGLAPGAPWRIFRGTSLVVRPTKVGTDNGFPSSGVNWCDIGADGSSQARPPTNPGGQGQPASGANGIQQDFLFPVSAPFLLFEAAFLLDGVPRSSSQNDFMSVDIGDGSTTWNLFYADAFTGFPVVSAQHRLRMTDPVRVRVDLRELFPDAGPNTMLKLRAAVGNGGSGVQPSRGYVDAFRLAPAAAATFRNGRDLNPAFYQASPAVLGGTWTVEFDTSFKTAARRVIVTGKERALAGILRDNGEQLTVGAKYFSLSFPVTGGLDSYTMPIPDDPSLLGLFIATQATLVGDGMVRGNAFDLYVGY